MKNPGLKAGLSMQQRPALLGRLRMADWIEMPEREFAREIEKVEKDPLFRKLFFGDLQRPSAIRRQRWPAGRLSSSFYEVNEQIVAGSERVQVEETLAAKADVAAKIKTMGREAFERYFIHADEPLTLQEIAKRTRVSLEDVLAIHDFLLEMGAQAEFEGPDRPAGISKSSVCLARLSVDGEEPVFEFFSPHWARGRYQVRYDVIEDLKAGSTLEADERRHLPHLLKRIETINLRQSTLYRVLETLTKLQVQFLGTKLDRDKRPISLRQLARRLDLAPSTISRALSGRTVRLPWQQEVPLITLVPGRRNVVRRIMAEWLKAQGAQTDAALAERLSKEYGIKVSRRTVNAVRHELQTPAG